MLQEEIGSRLFPPESFASLEHLAAIGGNFWWQLLEATVGQLLEATVGIGRSELVLRLTLDTHESPLPLKGVVIT